MGKKISNVESTTGWKVAQERPIDDRSQFPSLQDLIDYTNSPGLFSLYEGLITYVEDEKKNYRWAESIYGILPETGDGKPAGIRYPPNHIRYGVDYGNRLFNWVIDDKSVIIEYISTGLESIHILAKDLPHSAVQDSIANVTITSSDEKEIDIPGEILWTKDEFMTIKIYPAYSVGLKIKIKIS
ncbi:MAG: hypothetical protein KAH32_04725 [Chlamydiia bacterium]|nr:hypothetical protein [Chlamydiia bacterium]